MNKFYALMITAGVIASGVVGCGGEAPKKEEKKSAPVAPAKKEEGKKEEKEVPKEELNLVRALEKVLLQERNKSTICKGLHEVCKAIDQKTAKLVLLAADCDEPKYKQLINALCKTNMVPIYEVETRETLGLWMGMCKIIKKKEAKKIRKCTCVAIKDFGETTEYTTFIFDALKIGTKEVKAE